MQLIELCNNVVSWTRIIYSSVHDHKSKTAYKQSCLLDAAYKKCVFLKKFWTFRKEGNFIYSKNT